MKKIIQNYSTKWISKDGWAILQNPTDYQKVMQAIELLKKTGKKSIRIEISSGEISLSLPELIK